MPIRSNRRVEPHHPCPEASMRTAAPRHPRPAQEESVAAGQSRPPAAEKSWPPHRAPLHYCQPPYPGRSGGATRPLYRPPRSADRAEGAPRHDCPSGGRELFWRPPHRAQARKSRRRHNARHTEQARPILPYSSLLPPIGHNPPSRVSESAERIGVLVGRSDLDPKVVAALRVIAIANLLALRQPIQVPEALESLTVYVAAQPETFKISWSFEGTKHFIIQHASLAPYQTLAATAFCRSERRGPGELFLQG